MLRILRLTTIALLPATLGGCGWLADALILYPQHGAMSQYGATRRTLVARGAPIAGRTLELFYGDHVRAPGEPDLYVLSLTGNGGRAERMTVNTTRLLRHWLRHPDTHDRPRKIRIVALQYPGFGRDRQPASLEACAQATLEALDDLRRRAGKRPLLIHGISLGAAFALHAARMRPGAVQGLILEKPPNLRSMILWRHGWWNLWLVAGPLALSLPEALISDENAAQVGGVPAIFLISPIDWVTPAAYAREITEVYNGKHRVVETRTGHNQAVAPDNAPELVAALAWLWRHVR